MKFFEMSPSDIDAAMLVKIVAPLNFNTKMGKVRPTCAMVPLPPQWNRGLWIQGWHYGN